MVAQRTIRGLLANFLGTYTSRYSDYDGYWLFGYLVADLDVLRIDLLAEAGSKEAAPLPIAIHSAAIKFADQMTKARVDRSQIQEAWLVIQRSTELRTGLINWQPRSGYDVRFCASVVMKDGRSVEREVVLFVAPHDVTVELRSGRAT
jgi:hypothetical protein